MMDVALRLCRIRSASVRVMNALDMKEFNRGSFDVIIDKGTLDSILVCGVND